MHHFRDKIFSLNFLTSNSKTLVSHKKLNKTKLIHIQKSQASKMSTPLVKFKVKVFRMRF